MVVNVLMPREVLAEPQCDGGSGFKLWVKYENSCCVGSNSATVTSDWAAFESNLRYGTHVQFGHLTAGQADWQNNHESCGEDISSSTNRNVLKRPENNFGRKTLKWKSGYLKLSFVHYAFKWCRCSENICKRKLALWCFSHLFLLVFLDVLSHCCIVGRLVVHVVWSHHTPFTRTESLIKFFLTVELCYSHSAQLPSLRPRVWFYAGLYLDV